MSPRHIGVYFVIWACHLCRRDGGWLPRLLWEQKESPLVPGQICKLRRPLVRLYNERTRNLPLASLPREGPGSLLYMLHGPSRARRLMRLPARASPQPLLGPRPGLSARGETGW